MGTYMLLDKDIQLLEEKAQTLKSFISAEEYEQLTRKIEELKQLGIELPEDHLDDAKISELIKGIINLQFTKFTDKVMNDVAKTSKKDAFLQKLQYISASIEKNEHITDLITAAEEYWESIEPFYDDFERRIVREKIDEIKLAATLKNIQKAGKVDMSEISLKQNHMLIRDKLLGLKDSSDISDEDKLLINSWLGEGTDINSGKIDIKAMEQLVKQPKLWGILAGVKENRMQVVEKAYISAPKEISNEESTERKQEIEAVCKKYRIKEEKLRVLLENSKDDVFIIRKGPFYSLITESKRRKKMEKCFERMSNNIINRNIKAVVCRNSKKIINEFDMSHSLAPETIVLPDNLVAIGRMAFSNNYNLKTIRFPEGLRCIQEDAFSFTELESVTLPDSLEDLQADAFFHTPLKELKIGKNLEIISNSAFKDCNLEKVDIPGNVKQISAEAFANNPLSELVLHEGTEIIEENAFANTKLTEISLPSSVKLEPSVTIANDYTIVRQPNSNTPRKEKEGNEEKKEPTLTLAELKASKKELETMLMKVNELIRNAERDNSKANNQDKDTLHKRGAESFDR